VDDNQELIFLRTRLGPPLSLRKGNQGLIDIIQSKDDSFQSGALISLSTPDSRPAPLPDRRCVLHSNKWCPSDPQEAFKILHELLGKMERTRTICCEEKTCSELNGLWSIKEYCSFESTGCLI
jgi:hypothetical protein